MFLSWGVAAQTYDPNAQWSTGTNTAANQWQYGTSTVFGGPVTLYSQHGSSATPRYDWWSHDGVFNGPVIGFNGSGDTITIDATIDLVWPSGAVLVAPGGKGTTPRVSVLRWVAPTTGAYDVSGKFSDLQAATTAMRILNNGTEVFAADFAGSASYKGDVPFALKNVFVTKDTPIDFAVDSGGNDGNDVLGVTATITPSPEPSTIGVLAILPLALRRRRLRRRA